MRKQLYAAMCQEKKPYALEVMLFLAGVISPSVEYPSVYANFLG